MSDFLLEILSEEIPSSMQLYAESNLKNLFLKEIIDKLKLSSETLKILTSPRRIAVFVKGIKNVQNLNAAEKKGPAVNADKKNVESFLEANKKTQDDLFIRQYKGREYFFIKNQSEHLDLKQFFKKSVENILNNFHWPKPMRWHKYKLEWIRPITSLLCMLENELVPISFYHYRSCEFTFGSRILSKNVKINIEHVSAYEDQLEKNFVIADQVKRSELLLAQIRSIEEKNNFKVLIDDKLLKEIVGIIEWPLSILGTFDKKFLDLPAALIKSVLERHQKIFCVYQGDKITNHFVVVANFRDHSVVKGYEKVVSARLHDAASMVLQDKKNSLLEHAKKLDQITFHRKLGNFAQKSDRITSLAKFVAVWVPNSSIIDVENAAKLCKADLATSIVKDFPEMGGLIGSHYLKDQGVVNKQVISAIQNHNAPVDATDSCTKEPAAIAISIADKIDNVVGFFSIGEKITSASDPLGIRRSAIGFLRTVLENKINLSLKVLVMKAVDLYPNAIFCNMIEKIGLKQNEKKKSKNQAIKDILDFLFSRLQHLIESAGIDKKIFECSSKCMHHPVLVYKKCLALNAFCKSQEGVEFLLSLRRMYKILEKESEFLAEIKNKYSQKLLQTEEENALDELITNCLSKDLNALIKSDDFDGYLKYLYKFAPLIDKFMNNVKINDKVKEIKANRLSLLLCVSNILEEVFKFKNFVMDSV